jgi:hypothetical protein
MRDSLGLLLADEHLCFPFWHHHHLSCPCNMIEHNLTREKWHVSVGFNYASILHTANGLDIHLLQIHKRYYSLLQCKHQGVQKNQYKLHGL